MRFALAAVLLAGNALAADYTAPPRNVDDILAVLDQYKPDPAALAKRQEVLKRTPPSADNKRALAQYYLERARAYNSMGSTKKYIEDLRLAAEAAKDTMVGGRAAGGEGDEARILVDLSHAEMTGGNFQNAMRARDEMLHKTQNLAQPRPGFVFAGYVGVTIMNATMGDVAGAKAALAEAERIFVRLRQVPVWPMLGNQFSGVMERARAHVFLAEGNYAAAEAALRKGVQFLDAGREGNAMAWRANPGLILSPGLYMVMRNGDQMRLAWTMMQQGRLSEAEVASRDALVKNLSFFGRDHMSVGGSLMNLSRVVFEQGRYREAGILSSKAIEIMQRAGAAPESMGLAETRKAYGASLVAQEKFTDALPVYEAMQAGLAADPFVLQRFGKGDINWAYALVRAGQPKPAAAMLRELVGTASKRLGDNDRGVAELRGYLGLALAADGQREPALAEFQRAVPALLDAARSDQASETGGIARSMRLTNVLEAYLALLATVGTPEAAAEAFRIADVARGSSVQRALAESAARTAIRDPALADIARKEQDAHGRIAVLSDLLSRLLGAPPEQQLTKIIGDVRRDLDALRLEQAKLRKEIQSRFPEYAALTAPKPLTLAEAQAALRAGEALVAIYVAADKTYAWAIPQKGAPSFTVAAVGRQALGKRVEHLRVALDIADASLAKFPKFDLAASYALYAEILKPIEAGFAGANSLLIVPHGALGHLPFAVLTTEPHVLKPDPGAAFETYKDAPWLIKRASITQLPSVGTLATLRRAAKPTAGRREFIGIGDPMFTKTQVASAPSASPNVTRSIRTRNLAIAKVEAKTVVEADANAESGMKPAPVAVTNSSELAQLAPLPDTSEELLRIAEVLRADATQDLFLRLQASESIIKKLDLSKRRVIAFATHGLVPGDLNGLTQPALALSAPDVVGGTDDGLLTMEEILALKLDADWVVLSACNTASGEGAGAEAVSGLGRAFFYAGARALLVSNWPVETTSARQLTTGLFRQQAEKPGLSRAEALRQIMLELMAGPGPENGGWGFTYGHPMFWAPFSLVGEGGV
ncbi:MAG TPA: CHAT domain-containing protein [Burkholderiales bacterium]|nr:CHAT domain-containing protein [Burkholderiales bacterium]